MNDRLHEHRLYIGEEDSGLLSAIAIEPRDPLAAYVFAHGAGAGMDHVFLEALSYALAHEGIATLRYNFPYMEARRRVPDRQPVLIQTVRTAVREASLRFAGLPLCAGGKSMGGRMTSIAQSESPLDDVRGLIFLGFPLHPAGRPSSARAEHLAAINIPLLFIQGTRDRLADSERMRKVVKTMLHGRTTLMEIPSGDHSLNVPRRSGRTTDDVLREVAGGVRSWISSLAEGEVRP